MTRMRDFGPNLRQLLASMFRQAGELRLQQTASSLTLLTLMAAVPTAALGLLVLTASPAFESMRAAVLDFLGHNLFLPSFSAVVSGYIQEFVGAAGRLSAIGTAVFFATALSAMSTIDHTLNGIWRTRRARPLPQRLALYWALLTLGPVLLGGALVLHLRMTAGLGGAASAGGVFDALTAGLPWMLGVLVLALLYRLAPNERVKWRHALVGALVAALLLEGLKRLFGLYIAYFPSFTVVYGAFAALPLLFVWLIALWMSVLVGALLAANLRFWGVPLGPPHEATPAGEFDRMVRVLAEVVRAGPAQVPASRFRPDFDGDPRAADRVASMLASRGYLVRVWPTRAGTGRAGVWDELWLPGAALRSLTLRPLFDAVWGAEGERRRTRPSSAAQAAARVDPGGAMLTTPLAELFDPGR
jgi:membrane protein